MSDHEDQPESAGHTNGGVTTVASSAFPSEVFPCPACGQLLAPSCRVCVACKQPIDPAKINLTPVPVSLAEAAPAQSIIATVRFPWPLFLALLLIRILLAGLAERGWGLLKAELVLGAIEMICAVWVFYDANRIGAPRPFRWALGTVFLWPIVFPWYLVRRKMPRALCPFVEGIGLPIVLLALVAIGVLFALLKIPMTFQ
jgi:hypothetical protein